jgi:Mce-associated membrane protein
MAVVVLLAAGLVVWQADRERSTDNVGNHALVDDDGTTDVQAAVARALVRVFSFDHADPAPTEQAADEVLAGQARKDYDLLFDALEERAPGQQLVLTAQVQVAAVQELDGDRAKLLVFVDQASQRAADEESSISAAQLSIDAERVDGEWRITALRPL